MITGERDSAVVSLQPEAGRSTPISFEYTGNMSRDLTLNPEFVEALMLHIGEPRRNFVLRDGPIKQNKMEFWNSSGWTFASRFIKEKEYSVTQSDREYVVLINGGVIDENITERKRQYQPSLASYRKEFLDSLKKIVRKQLKKWADSEVDNRAWGKQRSSDGRKQIKHDYKRFWRQKGPSIFLEPEVQKT